MGHAVIHLLKNTQQVQTCWKKSLCLVFLEVIQRKGLRGRDKVRQDKINAGGMQSISLLHTSLDLEAQRSLK